MVLFLKIVLCVPDYRRIRHSRVLSASAGSKWDRVSAKMDVLDILDGVPGCMRGKLYPTLHDDGLSELYTGIFSPGIFHCSASTFLFCLACREYTNEDWIRGPQQGREHYGVAGQRMRELRNQLGRVFRFSGVMNVKMVTTIHNTHKAENPWRGKFIRLLSMKRKIF